MPPHKNTYFLSLVIPGILSVIAKFYPAMQLYKVDLPELGNPIIQTVK